MSPVTIQANDGTRVTINPALGGLYLADLDAGPGPDDSLVIANPSATATTARVTYIWANGSGVVQDLAMAANSRQQFYLPTQVGLNGPSSVAVQSLTAGVPLDTEHVQAWNGWSAWRATEGAVPAATWYFAEGNISTFEEYLAIFNPEPVAVSVTATAYRAGVSPTTGTVIIPAGPGRVRMRVRDWLGTVGDHATRVTATRLDTGAPALVVAERTEVWEADQRGGASTPGVSTLATTWHLAEGNKGALDSYYAIVNPQATAQTVSVTYRHENGFLYTGSLSVGANGRVTFTIPSWIPDGNVGMTVSAPLGIAVERSMYGGTSWTVGHAGVASPSAGYTWRFAKGEAGAGADTYFAMVNIGGSPTTATFTFRTSANTTVTTTLWLPAQCRATLYANAVPGLTNTSFRTTVTASEPIVVERAMYWPGSSGSSLTVFGETLAQAMAGDAMSLVGESGQPVDAATLAERQAVFPYVLTPIEPADAASQARAAGTISAEEQAHLECVAKARTTFLKKAPPGTQSGVAPPLFLAPASSATAPGGATTTAVALPWNGGFLVLGRLQ